LQLLVKLTVAHLLQDVGIPCRVNFECLGAVGADDFDEKQLLNLNLALHPKSTY
jgi:hypothetical protein